MLSIHNNLSAGTQNVTGTYVIMQAVVNNALTWQSSCVITLEKSRSLYIQGYNFEVYAKTLCHCN